MDTAKISKLQQVVRLRQMLHKWQQLARRRSLINTRLLRLGKSSSFPPSAAAAGTHAPPAAASPRPAAAKPAKKPPPVPSGHLAVYVGEGRKRFVVKTAHLSHPIFAALLKKTQELHLGFQHHGGPLTIPCDALFFEHLMWVVHQTSSSSSSPPPPSSPSSSCSIFFDDQHLRDLLDFYLTEDSCGCPTCCTPSSSTGPASSSSSSSSSSSDQSNNPLILLAH